MSKQKLELVWVGKEKRARLEPRILIEDPAKSYHAAKRVSKDDIFDNMLIHGDNLLALKALEQEYAGKVKCIYIDPPYNTGNAFEHYDDGIEHSLWLSLMRDRLELLRNLLSDDGSIWINLDDNESHYCKVLCDELFGRSNFVGSIIWEKSDSPRMDARFFSTRHDYILTYAKDITKLSLKREFDDQIPPHYNKKDQSGRIYYLKPLRVMGGNISESLFYALVAPDNSEIFPYNPDGSKSCWRWSKKKIDSEKERIEWVYGKNGWSPYFRIYADSRKGTPIQTIWTHEEAGSNRTSKNEANALFSNDVFGTPKPEKLIKKLLSTATNKGDLVLDSFLGSGTTAAVAHKMGRRWIGIELGDHCDTHCAPRLKKVIDGEDQGGITKSANWQGGGGFRYYNLAPSLIKFDEWGNPVINKQFDEHMLVRALCKIEGFDFDPSPDTYWKQGKSTETDFIYITTQHLTAQMLTKLNEDVGQKNSLLICCGSFDGNAERYGNLTIKKIPKSILKKCEWNHDDYSLEIKNLPFAEPTPSQPAPAKKSFKKQKNDKDQLDLFGENK